MNCLNALIKMILLWQGCQRRVATGLPDNVLSILYMSIFVGVFVYSDDSCQNKLVENLLVILFSERSEMISSDAAQARFRFLQTCDLERGNGSRSWLSWDHAPETCHPPRAHVVVGANWHQKLFRQLYLGDWRPEKVKKDSILNKLSFYFRHMQVPSMSS